MIDRRPFYALAFLLACGTTAAQADTWRVVEGPGGKIAGVWVVKVVGGTLSGDATMRGEGGKPLTYAVAGRFDGRTWTLNRVKPSDGNLCTYSGTSPGNTAARKPTEIVGSAMCQSRTGVWRVRIVPGGK